MSKCSVILCVLLGLVGSYAQLTPCPSVAYVAALCRIPGKLPITWYLRGGQQCGCVTASSVTSVALPSYLVNSIKGGATIACNIAGGTLDVAPISSASSIKLNGQSLTNNQQCLPSSASGDPHLVGFDGSKFEFNGFAGGVFNLISERDHQVNVLLDDFGVADATYIRDIGVKFGNVLSLLLKTETVVVEGKVHASTTAEVNGLKLPESGMNTSSVFDFGGAAKATVSVTKSVHGGEVVQVSTNAFEFLFQREAGALHFDMSINILMPVSMHGVLGQTMQWTENSKFEGDEADYVVSDLLADDFKFNLFQGATPKIGNVRALLGLPMPANSLIHWRAMV